MFRFLRWLFGGQPTQPSPVRAAHPIKPTDDMDEGGYHSGPAGYSPNTPYPQTQYGSGFDDGEDWAEHDH